MRRRSKVKAELAEIPAGDELLSTGTSSDRKTLRNIFFRRAFDALTDGIMFLMLGGYESTREMKETTCSDGFTLRLGSEYVQRRHRRLHLPDSFPFPTAPDSHRVHLSVALLDAAGNPRTADRGRIRQGHVPHFQGWEHETGEPEWNLQSG
ncbi:MAG: hypothetical protein H6978_09440 [Gammaproteobacteria bacterium]|nr:hypothetical protein [Gammaproteobacteria bacterium]